MKPKFRLGDRVTVIKPYVAPIPDDVKDSRCRFFECSGGI